MAAVFPGQVTAAQVGTYFVGQYYHILQQQPNLVYQFYTDASTMVRIDGATAETATGMMQIHSLVMTLNFAGIEIKTAHSIDSWEGGVLVMISGLVQAKDYVGRRKFVQTIFLAPQEKGYFVLNDILHLLDEEQIHQYPSAILAHGNYESNLVAPNQISEPVSDYMLGEEIQSRDYVAPVHVEESDTVDKYSIPEPQQQVYSIPEPQQQVYSIPEQQVYSIPEQQQQVYSIPEQQQQVSETDYRVDETPVEEPIVSFQNAVNVARDPPSAPAEEPVGEQPKQTYASILRLAKAQSSNSGSQAAPSSKSAPGASEWGQAPQSAPQQSYPAISPGPERSNSEAVEDVSVLEDEGEEKSVYVGNVPSSISESDLEHEFKNFGRIKPDGVAIRSRKDSGGYYAFVEFEDVIGVRNALKASPILINGWQIYVEERRPNSSMSRGGRRGRGRGGGYQSEAPRGRFGGRTFGRGSGQDNDREYNSRARTNGVQRVPRQERGILGNHVMRNEQYPSETA